MKSKQRDSGYQLVSVLSEEGPRMVPYKLERSRRLKRMYLQFDSPQYVTLKLPYRSSEKRGLEFIEEHADWICQTLDKQPRAESLQKYLLRHPRLALHGSWHRLETSFHKGAPGYIVNEDERLVFMSLNSGMDPSTQFAQLLKKLARDCLSQRVAYWSGITGIKAHGVTVRNQKSRWGSCSETGGISLNWRLILISPKLQDHVLLHELAHIRHFDHSRDFHAFLNSLDPRTSEHAERLNGEAMKVMSLGWEAR